MNADILCICKQFPFACYRSLPSKNMKQNIWIGDGKREKLLCIKLISINRSCWYGWRMQLNRKKRDGNVQMKRKKKSNGSTINTSSHSCAMVNDEKYEEISITHEKTTTTKKRHTQKVDRIIHLSSEYMRATY